jgi:hypothetical protein
MTTDRDDEAHPDAPDAPTRSEEVERRLGLRGPIPGLRLVLAPPRGGTFEAVEASARSFFAAADDPDVFRLGEVVDAVVERGPRRAVVSLEVIRKEIHPRRGLALRVVAVVPESAAVLEQILEPVFDREGRQGEP